MSASTTAELGEQFHAYLEQGAKEMIGKAFDEAIAAAVEQAEAKRDEFIAATAVKLRKWSQIEDFTDRLVITVEKPKES